MFGPLMKHGIGQRYARCFDCHNRAHANMMGLVSSHEAENTSIGVPL